MFNRLFSSLLFLLWSIIPSFAQEDTPSSANGMRSTEVETNSSTIGTTRIFEFPCSEPNTNSLLIEVVRKSEVTEGKYRITPVSGNPLSISGSNILCQNTSYAYTIEGPPDGATVIWASSPSITLQNTTGLTASIQSFDCGGAGNPAMVVNPNPALDVINISILASPSGAPVSDEGNALIRIFDHTGNLKMTEQTSGAYMSQYVGNWIEGVYFIHLLRNGKVATTQFLIQRN